MSANAASEALQSNDVDLAVAAHAVEMLMEFVDNLRRTEEEFEKYMLLRQKHVKIREYQFLLLVAPGSKEKNPHQQHCKTVSWIAF